MRRTTRRAGLSTACRAAAREGSEARLGATLYLAVPDRHDATEFAAPYTDGGHHVIERKVHAPDFYPYKKSNLVRRYEKAMEGTQGVDPAIIADQLGLQVRTVCRIQRKLGLRQCKAVNVRRQT